MDYKQVLSVVDASHSFSRIGRFTKKSNSRAISRAANTPKAVATSAFAMAPARAPTQLELSVQAMRARRPAPARTTKPTPPVAPSTPSTASDSYAAKRRFRHREYSHSTHKGASTARRAADELSPETLQGWWTQQEARELSFGQV